MRAPWAIAALTLAMSAPNLANAQSANAAQASSVIQIAASMNSMARACGHMSDQEVDQALAKQRSAAVADMGVKPAEFDRLYAGFVQDFNKRWGQGTAAQKKQGCDQAKAMSQIKLP